MNPDNTLVRLYCNDYSTWYMIPPTATSITDESKEIQDTAFPLCVGGYFSVHLIVTFAQFLKESCLLKYELFMVC